MTIKSPQAKGRRGEYFVRDLLRGFGYKADRNPMSGAISWLKGDLRSNFPFFLEIKNTQTTTFVPWYHKAETQSGARPPIIVWVHKGDAYAFVKFSDFLMALQGKLPQLLRKPGKHPKLGLEETAQLKFSKLAQVHRKEK